MADAFDELLGAAAAPDPRSEKAILNATLVQVSALPETIVWRNNTGTAWQGDRLRLRPGQWIEVQPDMVVLANARPITFGLSGSGDILGASRGRPVSIETKKHSGSQSGIQRNFERAWVRCGGLYVLARSAEDALAALR